MKPLLLVLLLTLPTYAQSLGDSNNSGDVTMSDVVYLINYIFGGGPAPAICPATLRTDWVEVDTTVSVVWILDRAFPVDTWPFRVQNHFYITSDSTRTDTTIIREVVVTDASWIVSGNELIRTR